MSSRDRGTAALLQAALNAQADSTSTPPAPDLERILELAARQADPIDPRQRGGVPRGRLIAAGAVAAVLAAGVAWGATPSADNVIRGAEGPAPTSPIGQGTASGSSEAGVLLMKIAQVAQTTPLAAPRPDQFTYARTLTLDSKHISWVPGPVAGLQYEVKQFSGDIATSEVWTPQTPGPHGLIRRTVRGNTEQDNYSTGPGAGPGKPDLGTYAGLCLVPTHDPKSLIAAILTNSKRTDSDTDTSVVLRNIIQLDLLAQVLPPDFAAATYRALAGLADITETRNVIDLAGRTGVAIGTTDRDGERYELVFDPMTFTPLGSREYPAAAGPRSQRVEDSSKDPTYTDESAFLTVATVDRPGEVPKP